MGILVSLPQVVSPAAQREEFLPCSSVGSLSQEIVLHKFLHKLLQYGSLFPEVQSFRITGSTSKPAPVWVSLFVGLQIPATSLFHHWLLIDSQPLFKHPPALAWDPPQAATGSLALLWDSMCCGHRAVSPWSARGIAGLVPPWCQNLAIQTQYSNPSVTY